MTKYFIVIAVLVAVMLSVGSHVCNVGQNLLNVATQELLVDKPAPSLTQPYSGGLLHYVDVKEGK